MKTDIITPDQSILLECGHPESPHSSFTRGYGTDATGKRSCYTCCAEFDKKHMREAGKIVLYLTHDQSGLNPVYKLTNWPASLSLPVRHMRKGRHNIARTRYDVWFNFEGKEWHGVQYGDNTQITHCRLMKS